MVVQAVGLTYWWWYPIQVSTSHKTVASDRYAHTEFSPAYRGDWFDPFGSTPHYRHDVISYRRVGWGDFVRHGQSVSYNEDGRMLQAEQWRSGRRDGAFHEWSDKGQLLVMGQFHQGRKDGKWVTWDGRGLRRNETIYDNGQPLRKTFILKMTPKEYAISVDYKDGKLVRLNGQTVTQFTPRLREAPEWIQDHLDRDADFLISNKTVPETVDSWHDPDRDDIPWRLHPAALDAQGYDLNRRFSLEMTDLPRRVGILVFLVQAGLVCDYRFREIVVTTASDADTWTDQTGVDELQPDPGSPWAKLLDRETGVEYTTAWEFAQDLHTAGAKIWLHPALPADSVEQTNSVIIHDSRKPLRYWLHLMLGRLNIRCELDGDTLKILP